MKSKEVKGCYLSNDAAHTLLECRIVLLNKVGPLSCFQTWQLKLAKERFLGRKTNRFVYCLKSQPGAAVTILGHSEMVKMRDGLIATHVPTPYG